MNAKWETAGLVGALVTVISISVAEESGGASNAQQVARMRQWHEAKFGMFIHWGLYSALAGEYNGKQIGWKEVVSGETKGYGAICVVPVVTGIVFRLEIVESKDTAAVSELQLYRPE